ncbi:glyoxylate/succinic semialdehyde reductase 1-like isoform X1 [Cornus florida]|uniref:glyoxylate/succinic semialdehyde reductase 1-like isoform X1 n=1 Tax=Cornus florida TaxID=4283 RepID=UPI00289CC52B|nr:glyoxylate/succinic semialdehyde reductase 1-like isoform X1 [Cornus florida]
MEEEIGLLGLGIMGMAMSRTLLRHGANLTVWNRTPSKCEQLVEYGASVAETAAAVVKKCKYTIAMLSDPSAALSVVFDKDGVLEQICKGKGYIDMSTVDADTSSKISEAITSKGGSFLEAPVSGSRKLAQDGELVILAAGVKALYEEAHCLFDIMGKKTFFLGHVGNGAKMKLLVNMLMGSVLAAFSEGVLLAEKSELDPQSILNALDRGGFANPLLLTKGISMIESCYSHACPLEQQLKDMRLSLALGNEKAVSMEVAAAANDAFEEASIMGFGGYDFSAVHEAVKDLSIRRRID